MSLEIPISLKYAKPIKSGWYRVCTDTSGESRVHAYYWSHTNHWFWNEREMACLNPNPISSICCFYSKDGDDWKLNWEVFNIVEDIKENPFTINEFLNEFSELETYEYLRKKYKGKTLKDFISNPEIKKARKDFHIDDLINKTSTEETIKTLKIFG